jgi:pimeloyl-ACP methyl ester carboxylesterase
MTKFSKVSGANIAYEIQGEGPPLVLIHGAEGSRRSFDKIAPNLSKWFTVISYDQRDCGETENVDQPASLDILANDIKQLLANLGYATASVYGTSFGGRVAQAFALLYPELIDRLILASTWPISRMLKDLNPEVALTIFKLRQNLPDSAELLAEYFFPPDYLKQNPQYKLHFKNANPKSDRSVRRAGVVTSFLSLDISDIRARTLLIAGLMDRLVPPELTIGMERLIANCESKVIEGAGHVSYLQMPDEVIRHIEEFRD